MAAECDRLRGLNLDTLTCCAQINMKFYESGKLQRLAEPRRRADGRDIDGGDRLGEA